MPRGRGGRGGRRGSMGVRGNYSGNNSFFSLFNSSGGIFSSLRRFFSGNNMRPGQGSNGGFSRGRGMGGMDRSMRNFSGYNAGFRNDEEAYNNMSYDTGPYDNPERRDNPDIQPFSNKLGSKIWNLYLV